MYRKSDKPARKYTVVRGKLPDLDLGKLDHVAPIDVETKHQPKSDTAPADAKSTVPGTLTELCREHFLFTVGPIIAASRFDRDPVAEYMALKPKSNPALIPRIIDYSEPFFRGMGIHPMPRSTAVPNLDYRLYAIHQDAYEDCINTIGSFNAIDPRDGYFAMFPFYQLQIADIPALKKMTVVDDVPLVTVTVFAVESTAGTFMLDMAIYPKLPTLVRRPASQDFAQRMQHIKERAKYEDKH